MEPTVVDKPEESRFELHIGDDVAGVANYRDQDGHPAFFHTEVNAEFAGQGLGGKLVQGVLEAMRERGETIYPICPFIAGYIEEHPECADVVVPSMRKRFARESG